MCRPRLYVVQRKVEAMTDNPDAGQRWVLEVHANGSLCCKSFTGRPTCYWCVNEPSNTDVVPVVPESLLLAAVAEDHELDGPDCHCLAQADECFYEIAAKIRGEGGENNG